MPFPRPVLALCLALLVMQGLLPGAARASTPVDPQTEQLLQETLDKSIAKLGVPGAVAAVRLPNGATWTGVSGVSEIKPQGLTAMNDVGALGAGGVPGAKQAAAVIPGEREATHGASMDPGLKFRIASVTKTFTAMLTLMLAQDGVLSLDDTLGSWLPGIIQNCDHITIRQLLNHTAGTYNYTDRKFYDMVCANPGRAWKPEELVALAREHGPEFAPGKGWKYSNTGYVLLGMIIEKATGQEYRDVLKSRILDPLGLKDADIPRDETFTGGYAHGYVHAGDWVDFSQVSPTTGGPAACMTSTVDLLSWIDALTSGKLLNEKYQKEMNSFVSTGVNGFTYGLGLMNWRGAVGHNGVFFDAYTSCAYRYKDYLFVVLVNGNAKPGLGIDNAAQAIFWDEARAIIPASGTGAVAGSATRKG